MKRALVADASVAVAWVHPAQATRETEAMLDAIADGTALEVPALWTLEVANALTVLRRRRKLTEDEHRAALEMIRGLPITVDHEASSVALTTLVKIASELNVSVYDAAYLELATRRRLRLATKDAQMRAAASRHGVEIWTSES